MKFILMIIWGWEMNKLFVFVEGDDDVMFIENILLNHFQQDIVIIPITYQKKHNINIIKQIKKINSNNEMEYIFLSDLDSHSYSSIEDRKKKRIKEFHHEEYEDLDPNKIFIVVEEIESWYLAGIDSSLESFKDFDIPENTENFTKEQLDEMILNSDFLSKIDFFKEVSQVYDIHLAMQRNKSFRYFFKELNLL